MRFCASARRGPCAVLNVAWDASTKEMEQAVVRELEEAEARIQRNGCEHAQLTRECLIKISRS